MINDLIQRFKSVEENLQREIENDQNLLVIQSMDRELVSIHEQILSTFASNGEDACSQIAFLLEQIYPLQSLSTQSRDLDAIRELLFGYLAGSTFEPNNSKLANFVAEHAQNTASVHKIINQSAIRISLIGTDFRFRYTSAENCRFYGRSSTEIVGRHTAELIGDARFKGRAESFLDRCFSGEALSYFHTLDLPDDVTHIMNCRMEPYYENSGELSGAVVTMHDITDEISTTIDELRLEAIKPVESGSLRESVSR